MVALSAIFQICIATYYLQIILAPPCFFIFQQYTFSTSLYKGHLHFHAALPLHFVIILLGSS